MVSGFRMCVRKNKRTHTKEQNKNKCQEGLSFIHMIPLQKNSILTNSGRDMV